MSERAFIVVYEDADGKASAYCTTEKQAVEVAILTSGRIYEIGRENHLNWKLEPAKPKN